MKKTQAEGGAARLRARARGGRGGGARRPPGRAARADPRAGPGLARGELWGLLAVCLW